MAIVKTAISEIHDPYSDLPGFTQAMVMSGSRLRRVMLRNGFTWKCAICGIDEWLGTSLTLHVDHINGDKRNNNADNLRFLCPNCHSQTDTYCGRNKKKAKRTPVNANTLRQAYDHATSHGVNPSLSLLLRLLGRGQHTPTERAEALAICNALGLGIRKVSTSDKIRTIQEIEMPKCTSKIYWDDAWLAKAVTRRSLLDISKELGVSDNAVRKRCLTRGIAIPDTVRSAPRKPKSTASYYEELASVHGTLRGHRIELTLGKGTCALCRAARAEYQRSRVRKSLSAKSS